MHSFSACASRSRCRWSTRERNRRFGAGPFGKLGYRRTEMVVAAQAKVPIRRVYCDVESMQVPLDVVPAVGFARAREDFFELPFVDRALDAMMQLGRCRSCPGKWSLHC
jgi:hypothetical protein